MWKNLNYPKNPHPPKLCSAPPWHRPGRQAVWPGSLWGVYGPRRAAEGPPLCESVHPRECGPCCVANGPYPRCPPTPPSHPAHLWTRLLYLLMSDLHSWEFLLIKGWMCGWEHKELKHPLLKVIDCKHRVSWQFYLQVPMHLVAFYLIPRRRSLPSMHPFSYTQSVL